MCFEQEKRILREKYLRNTLQLDDSFAEASAAAFLRQLTAFDRYRSADSVFIYVSIKKEPATHSIIQHALECNKRVYVPKCLPNRGMAAVRIDRDTLFRPNRFSIPEPVCDNEHSPADALELCIIPCVAAAPDGRRLGHGGGYYDRFLAGSGTFKVCLCYEMNLSDTIPVTENDVLVNAILTEKRMIACS